MTSGSFQILSLTSSRLGLNSNLIVHSYTLAKSAGNELTVLPSDLKGRKPIQPDNRVGITWKGWELCENGHLN